MGINLVRDRHGNEKVEVSRRWPDGSRFRRYVPSKSVGKKTLARIEESIAMGTWRKLKEELAKCHEQQPQTVEEFSIVFLEQHGKVRMKSWKRYELSLKTLNARLGRVKLKEFQRHHLHEYVAKRAKKVKPSSVNRDIACIKKMFSFALETGAVEVHPLIRFPVLPVQEQGFQVMTVKQFRSLVEAMAEPGLSAMVAVLGETGIRKGEALHLKWSNVDLRNRILTLDQTKSRKVRRVPLSDYAVEWLRRTVRYLDCPCVFVNSRTGRPWVNPEKAFQAGRKAAKLDWVGFHDLRRFRATQWMRNGVDARTTQGLLGHADLKTTMRYAQFVPDHALTVIKTAEQAEVQELERETAREKSGRQEEAIS